MMPMKGTKASSKEVERFNTSRQLRKSAVACVGLSADRFAQQDGVEDETAEGDGRLLAEGNTVVDSLAA